MRDKGLLISALIVTISIIIAASALFAVSLEEQKDGVKQEEIPEQPKSNQLPPGFTRFYGDDMTLHYPQFWNTFTQHQQTTFQGIDDIKDYTVFSPATEYNPEFVTVTIAKENLDPDQTDLQQIYDESIEKASLFYTWIEIEDVTLSEEERTIEMTFRGQIGQLEFKAISYTQLTDTHGYTIVYLAQPNLYQTYLPTADYMFETFEVTA